MDAGDLQPGDVLYLRNGRQVAVDGVQSFHETQKTYNFAVDDLHCYAVGNLCVLVHNDCGTHSAKLRKNMGKAIDAGEEAHHIVPSGHPRAVAARKILADNGIDIDDPVNGIGLIASKHRGVGLHSFRSIDAVTRRLEDVVEGMVSGSDEAIAAIRQTLVDLRGEIAAGIIPGI